MTMNGAVLPILAMYIVEQGAELKNCRVRYYRIHGAFIHLNHQRRLSVTYLRAYTTLWFRTRERNVVRIMNIHIS